MLRNARHILEAVLLRAAPGLVNLFAFVSLAEWLGSEDYGLVSTVIAMSGFVASFTFGTLTFSVVASHAGFAMRGEAGLYESQHLTAVSLIAFTLIFFGAIFWALDILDLAWGAPAICLGTHTAIQEIHRARLHLFRYAAAASFQALVFFALLWSFVRPDPGADTALYAFALSYACGAALSLLLCGRVRLRKLDLAILRGPIAKGLPITLSTVVNDSVQLGFRILILQLGTPAMLGVFSFSLDLAKRLVGIFINIASFTLIPRAFAVDAAGDLHEFHRILRRGMTMVIPVSTLTTISVLVLGNTGLIGALQMEVFNDISFAILAAATVVNRGGKMVLTPEAMRQNRAVIIIRSLLIAGPVALSLAAISLTFNFFQGVPLSYLAGYVLWALICSSMLRSPQS